MTPQITRNCNEKNKKNCKTDAAIPSFALSAMDLWLCGKRLLQRGYLPGGKMVVAQHVAYAMCMYILFAALCTDKLEGGRWSGCAAILQDVYSPQ